MFHRKGFELRLPSRVLTLGKHTLVMGVLNVTPDSFSDGRLFLGVEAAVARALEIASHGADILDIGGESTRPGSDPVPAREQLRRVLPVLEKLRGRLRIPISIDTSSSEVAEASAAAGAEMVNDVTGLRGDPGLAEVAQRRRLPLVLVHMHGEPRTMQTKAFARHALRDVAAGLRRAISLASRVGVRRAQLILDPGIGFGKTYAQDYQLIARLPEVSRLGFPLLVGTSRKKFIGRVLDGRAPQDRVFGTAATVAASILNGAHIVRVHDVAEMVQVARVTDAVLCPSSVDRLPRHT